MISSCRGVILRKRDMHVDMCVDPLVCWVGWDMPVCICMWVQALICVGSGVRGHVGVHVLVNAGGCVHVRVCVCVFVCVYMYMCVHVHVDAVGLGVHIYVRRKGVPKVIMRTEPVQT